MVLKLETIVGTLTDAVRKFKKGTFQTSAEITTERKTNKYFGEGRYWTANVGVFEHNEDGTLSYYIGDRTAFNAVAVKNIDEFCGQLSSNRNYTLTDNQRKSLSGLERQGHIVKVDPSDLSLQGDKNESQYFEINTRDYSSLTKSQRALAEMVYGADNEFNKNMEGLAKSGVSNVQIYVLNPEYVKSNVKKGSAVARACRLYNFSNNSNFSAIERGVNIQWALRGVQVTSPKATRQKVEGNVVPNYGEMYKSISANPEEALRYLTAKTAAGLLRLVNAFYNPGK